MARTNVAAMKITRTMAQKSLSDVPDEKAFWSHDGKMFKNLKELAEGLKNMDDETFMYHANAYKNDFATWVRDVIEDPDLAKDLIKSMSHWDASKKITDRAYYLSSIK
jgi:hypothetical protein